MIIVLWILTGLLAAAFLAAGAMKALTPKERLQPRMGWVDDFSAAQVRGIGVLEILGALGLVLPAATGILPWLTPVAAFALAGVMVVAVFVHRRRGETIIPNLVLGALALIVGVGWLLLG